jgi:Predicted signal transduction protein with a C-terminal ATPase domain
MINGTITKYIDKSSYIIMSQYLVKNIQMDYSGDLEQMMYFSDIVSVMVGESFNDYIKRPYIIYSYNKTLYEGKFIDSIDRVEGNELVDKAAKSKATEIIWDQKLTFKNNKKYLTFYRNIVDNNNKSIGVLEVNIPYSDIESDMDSIGMTEKGLIFSTNDNGEVLYFNNQTNKEITNISSITQNAYIIASDWLRLGQKNTIAIPQKITVAIPKSEVYRKSFETFVILSILFVIYILVMLLASRITAQKITRNLESFINRIKQNSNLILNEELIQIRENDEVSFIKQKFKELVSRMNEIYKEMVNVKLENSTLEIELLQSRINPHLLYNSLSVIKWNASWNKDQKTIEMIDAMTKYYRTALNKGNSIISISSELDMIKEYVKINVYAHSISYNLEVDVEDRVLAFYTLKHLLQPVVENSILHGLNGRGEGASIIVKGYMEQSDIVFKVIDNGRGMDQETIDRILNLNYVANYGGYGIKNLIKRIQVYYGSNHGIKIESEIGGGTTVTVRIEALGENELKERMWSTREFN